MNSIEFTQYLKSLNACEEARLWASNKSWREVYNTCHRGDWLLWLYRKSKKHEFQKLTLAKGLCANTVRHLIKNEQSVKAVDAAIAFGKGEISRKDLDAADAPAYAAAYAASPASPADIAAYAAVYADSAPTYAAVYAANAAVQAGGLTAKKQNQQKTADIVREILPFEIWEF